MAVPEPALAPAIPPAMAPIVQVKLLATLDVNAILGLVPLQVLAVAELVTVGIGFTVTIIEKGLPTQVPVTDVGVTRYCTVPDAVLNGLVNI